MSNIASSASNTKRSSSCIHLASAVSISCRHRSSFSCFFSPVCLPEANNCSCFNLISFFGLSALSCSCRRFQPFLSVLFPTLSCYNCVFSALDIYLVEDHSIESIHVYLMRSFLSCCLKYITTTLQSISQ